MWTSDIKMSTGWGQIHDLAVQKWERNGFNNAKCHDTIGQAYKPISNYKQSPLLRRFQSCGYVHELLTGCIYHYRFLVSSNHIDSSYWAVQGSYTLSSHWAGHKDLWKWIKTSIRVNYLMDSFKYIDLRSLLELNNCKVMSSPSSHWLSEVNWKLWFTLVPVVIQYLASIWSPSWITILDSKAAHFDLLAWVHIGSSWFFELYQTGLIPYHSNPLTWIKMNLCHIILLHSSESNYSFLKSNSFTYLNQINPMPVYNILALGLSSMTSIINILRTV